MNKTTARSGNIRAGDILPAVMDDFTQRLDTMTPPPPAPTPPAATAPVSLLLDCEQTEVLAELGTCFIVAHTAACTGWPDVNGRMLLTVVPCTIAQANQAVGTITGTHRATKIRKPRAPAKTAATNNPTPA